MKWTCRRCGLQRDDRRGSGCSDVKGQAHDWVETEDYLNELSQWLWKKWLETTDGVNFIKGKEMIKNEYQQSIEPIQNTDAFLQHIHHRKVSNFFKSKRKVFVIGLTIISIVCAFLMKSYIFYLFIPVIAGLTWLVFFILQKMHFNKNINSLKEYMEMIKPFSDKKTEKEALLKTDGSKSIKDFLQKSARMQKLNNKEASFVIKNIYDIITEKKETEALFEELGFTY